MARIPILANIVPGWNIFDNTADTSDVKGRGTMVAGTAAVASNNTTVGATDSSDILFSWSNRGNNLDIVALGHVAITARGGSYTAATVPRSLLQ